MLYSKKVLAKAFSFIVAFAMLFAILSAALFALMQINAISAFAEGPQNAFGVNGAGFPSNYIDATSDFSVFENFLTRDGSKLMDGDKQWLGLGFNTPSLAVVEDTSASSGGARRHIPPDVEIEDTMISMAQMGLNAIRINNIAPVAGTDGLGQLYPIDDAFIIAAGVYNEEAFRRLDKTLQLANQLGIRVLMSFSDVHDFWGGVRAFSALYGYGASPAANVYYNLANTAVIQGTKDFYDYVINRTNYYTGVKYKDDKAIMAWQLGNEITTSVTNTGLVDPWSSEMASYLKSIDPNHLVCSGHGGTNYTAAHLNDPNIDIYEPHYSPNNTPSATNQIPGSVNGNNRDMAIRMPSDAAAVCGIYNKVIIAGEGPSYLSPAKAVETIDAGFQGGFSAMMYWAFKSHFSGGGFITHPEGLFPNASNQNNTPYPENIGLNWDDRNWPGKPSRDDLWEREYMLVYRQEAYKWIHGFEFDNTPAHSFCDAPILINTMSKDNIRFIGAAGGASYDLERKYGEDGAWEVIAVDYFDDVDIGRVPAAVMFADPDATADSYYRVKAYNLDGVASEYSNILKLGQIYAPPNDTRFLGYGLDEKLLETNAVIVYEGSPLAYAGGNIVDKDSLILPNAHVFNADGVTIYSDAAIFDPGDPYLNLYIDNFMDQIIGRIFNDSHPLIPDYSKIYAATSDVLLLPFINIVSNGDFSDGFNNWTVTGPGAGAVSIVDQSVANAEVYSTTPDRGSVDNYLSYAGGQGSVTISQTIPVVSGQKYRLYLWSKGTVFTNNTTANMYIDNATSNGWPLAVVANSPSWVENNGLVTNAPKLTFTATSSTITLRFTQGSSDLPFSVTNLVIVPIGQAGYDYALQLFNESHKSGIAESWYIDGRYLCAPDGEHIIVRGVEQSIWGSDEMQSSMVTEIGKSAANTVRILPYITLATPSGEPNCDLSDVEDAIQRGIAANMLVDVAIDGGQTVASYLLPDVKKLLLKYQKNIVIHIGESTTANNNNWVSQSINAVLSLRNAGYICPIYIMSNTYGRNLPTLLSRGQEVLDGDPLHNLVFGWQAYWGELETRTPLNYYADLYGMSLYEAIQACANAPFPIQVGIMEHTDPWTSIFEVAPYKDLMKWLDEYEIGWLWWDWHMPTDPIDQLSLDGTYGNWDNQGEDVFISNEYSIANTSIKPAFLSNFTTAITAVNAASTQTGMRNALMSPYLGLNLDGYNGLSGDKQMSVINEMLDGAVYIDCPAIQIALDIAVAGAKGIISVNTPSIVTNIYNAPIFPDVEAVLSDNTVMLLEAAWDYVDPSNYAKGNKFTAYGMLGNLIVSADIEVLPYVAGAAGGSGAAGNFPISNAFDGDIDTYYQSSSSGTNRYIGLDLRAGNQVVLGQVRVYAAPGHEASLNGAQIQGSNTSMTAGTTVLATLPAQVDSGWTTVYITDPAAWRYLRIVQPSNTILYVSEVQFLPFIIDNIEVSQMPDKTCYSVGSNLDLTGMIITATYNNGTTKEVVGYKTAPSSGDELNNIAEEIITIEYIENNVLVQTQLTVTVMAPSIIISGPETVVSGAGATAEYTISALAMPPLSGIDFQITLDGSFLGAKSCEILNGFQAINPGTYNTPLIWSNVGDIWTGKAILYNAVGVSGEFDIFKITCNVAEGKLGITDVALDYMLTSFAGSPIDSVIASGTVSTEFLQWYSPYDLNKDGVIDLNDITFALQYLLVEEGDPDWEVAQVCDFDGDKIINIGDLILILRNYTIPYYS